jgi:hypothetical protein
VKGVDSVEQSRALRYIVTAFVIVGYLILTKQE